MCYFKFMNPVLIVLLLFLLFRHSVKSLNAQEERLAPPAARDSGEVARA